MNIIDWILYIPLVFCVCYLLLYAIASKFYRPPNIPKPVRSDASLYSFPAYKEDRVILASIESFLEQDYPKELYDVIVISDQMKPETNEALQALPIRLLMANYTESSKAKALAMAMDSIDTGAYDIVVIMDADNMTTPDFLSTINRVFDSGIKSVQTHRTGKNLNTDISVLDSASEEINNGFFRSGHNAIGLSAGLSGSGMAFEAEWFHQNVKYLQTAGEDKELEAMLLQQRIYTVYLPDLLVFDEKTQKRGHQQPAQTLDSCTIRRTPCFAASLAQSTLTRKFRLLRQDMPMDASSTIDSIGRSFWTDIRFHRYRRCIKLVQWRI